MTWSDVVKATLRRALLEGGSCERCGCTEKRACPGGCSWNKLALGQGQLICTACLPDDPRPAAEAAAA